MNGKLSRSCSLIAHSFVVPLGDDDNYQANKQILLISFTFSAHNGAVVSGCWRRKQVRSVRKKTTVHVVEAGENKRRSGGSCRRVCD